MNTIEEDIVGDLETFTIAKLTGSKFGFGVDMITSSGVFTVLGVDYDLRPYLARFMYKQKDREWKEMFALSKGNVRELVTGRVDKIIRL